MLKKVWKFRFSISFPVSSDFYCNDYKVYKSQKKTEFARTKLLNVVVTLFSEIWWTSDR